MTRLRGRQEMEMIHLLIMRMKMRSKLFILLLLTIFLAIKRSARFRRSINLSPAHAADVVEEINLCDEEDINVISLEDEESDDVNQGIRISKTLDSSVCPSNKKSTIRKKKEKSIDVLGDLVGEIRNYVTAVMGTDERISTYFIEQTESNDRKMKIYEELIELSEFSQQEIMDVGEYILKDEHKVDNFFALPKIFRRDYVVKQLSKIHPK